jgi:hypothetical protein
MVDALNVKSIMYIGFRLAPFILISFFGLSSMFNSDIKGVIFVALLLLNCFITISIGTALPEDPFLNTNGNPNQICDALTLSKNGPISKLPLNVNIFMFTLAYLAYIIGVNNVAKTNVPTLVVFPIFILYQIYWSYVNGCNSIRYSFFSLILGGGLGALFSYAVDKTGLVKLQYFNGITNQDVCVRATNAKYRCSTKQNV